MFKAQAELDKSRRAVSSGGQRGAKVEQLLGQRQTFFFNVMLANRDYVFRGGQPAHDQR